MKIEFDEEQKQILISTPGGNSVLLNEENKEIIIEDIHI